MIKSNFRSYGKESWYKYGPCENHFEMFALGCCFSSFALIHQCRHLVCLVKVPFELQCKRKKGGEDIKCRVVAVLFLYQCIILIFALQFKTHWRPFCSISVCSPSLSMHCIKFHVMAARLLHYQTSSLRVSTLACSKHFSHLNSSWPLVKETSRESTKYFCRECRSNFLRVQRVLVDAHAGQCEQPFGLRGTSWEGKLWLARKTCQTFSTQEKADCVQQSEFVLTCQVVYSLTMYLRPPIAVAYFVLCKQESMM